MDELLRWSRSFWGAEGSIFLREVGLVSVSFSVVTNIRRRICTSPLSRENTPGRKVLKMLANVIYGHMKLVSFVIEELTAGYYNPSNLEGYSPVFEALKRHSVTVKFVCTGLQIHIHTNEYDKALADPEGLSWQVLNVAWDSGMSIAGENAVSCSDREGCMRIAETAIPRNHPDNHHFSVFVYHQPSPSVQGSTCMLCRFGLFHKMHERRHTKMRSTFPCWSTTELLNCKLVLAKLSYQRPIYI